MVLVQLAESSTKTKTSRGIILVQQSETVNAPLCCRFVSTSDQGFISDGIIGYKDFTVVLGLTRSWNRYSKYATEVGHGVGILTFLFKTIQIPHSWDKIIGQNVHQAASEGGKMSFVRSTSLVWGRHIRKMC